jgi:hypothetical protein
MGRIQLRKTKTNIKSAQLVGTRAGDLQNTKHDLHSQYRRQRLGDFVNVEREYKISVEMKVRLQNDLVASPLSAEETQSSVFLKTSQYRLSSDTALSEECFPTWYLGAYCNAQPLYGANSQK